MNNFSKNRGCPTRENCKRLLQVFINKKKKKKEKRKETLAKIFSNSKNYAYWFKMKTFHWFIQNYYLIYAMHLDTFFTFNEVAGGADFWLFPSFLLESLH